MTAPNVPIRMAHEFPGSELTGDVLEFIRAMHAYQKRYQRRYPAWSEVLYVLRTLGYAKRVPGADYSQATIAATDRAEGTDQNKS